MSASELRPMTRITGLVVALVAKPYDFTDDKTGERSNGISYRLWVARQDETSGNVDGVYELRVKQVGAKALGALVFGDTVAVDCSGFARQRGQRVDIEWTAETVTLLESGEVLAAA
jgi:hypothetical protein